MTHVNQYRKGSDSQPGMVQPIQPDVDLDLSTPFSVACVNGHTDVIELQLLLDHSSTESIDLNARTESGRTAFMISCINGNEDVVKILLDHSDSKNIDLNGKDSDGNTRNTAITLAYEYRKTTVFKLLGT